MESIGIDGNTVTSGAMVLMIIPRMLSSLLFSGFLVGLVTVGGIGLTHLLGLRKVPGRLFLAPSLALAVISVAIGLVVQFYIPVRIASPLLWIMFVVFVVCGLVGERDNLLTGRSGTLLVVAFLTTAGVLGGFHWYGVLDYLGSPALDGWSYVSFGEYLRLYPRGTEGGLAPLYQYASHLSSTRYVASAMLALFIPPWSNTLDTQMMVGPFFVITIFAFACAMAYVAHVMIDRGLSINRGVSVFLAVGGGWLPYGVLANNFDNLLVLSLAPTLFALGADRNLLGISRVIVPAVCSAAAIYIYPELAALILAGYGIAGIPSLFTKSDRGKQLFLWLGVAAITLVLISPYLPDAVKFVENQLAAAANRGPRPGQGIMPNLLVPARLPAAIWGLNNSPLSVIIGVLLGGICVTGAVAVVRTRFYSFLVYLVLVLTLFLVMTAIKQYDYGAYKILLLGWWAVTLLLVAGGNFLWTNIQIADSRMRVAMRIAVFSVFSVSAILWAAQQYKWTQRFNIKSALPFREVREYVAGLHEIVSVSVSETSRNSWLVYQLRDMRVIFTEYHGYMDQTHVRPLMFRSDVPRSRNVGYLVIEEGKLAAGQVVWRNELFKVLRNEGAASPVIASIDAPNGVEQLDGATFFWVGRDPAAIVLHSGIGQAVQLDIEIRSGPGVGQSPIPPRVSIEYTGAELLALDTHPISKQTVQLTLYPGKNEVVFRARYGGVVSADSSGDPRVLLAGIKLLGLKHVD